MDGLLYKVGAPDSIAVLRVRIFSRMRKSCSSFVVTDKSYIALSTCQARYYTTKVTYECRFAKCYFSLVSRHLIDTKQLPCLGWVTLSCTWDLMSTWICNIAFISSRPTLCSQRSLPKHKFNIAKRNDVQNNVRETYAGHRGLVHAALQYFSSPNSHYRHSFPISELA